MWFSERPLALFFIQLAVIIATVIISAVVVTVPHELAHIFVGKWLGLPYAGFSLYDQTTGAPTVHWGTFETSTRLTITHWVGGLSGALFAVGVFLVLLRWIPEKARWVILTPIAGIISWQLCVGVLEGAFHDSYIPTEPGAGSVVQKIQLLSLFLGMVIGFGSLYLLRNRRQ